HALAKRCQAMPALRKKSDLPHKTCCTCGLLFAWRKKWARDWEQVRYCSERCRQHRPSGGPGATP
ncbi:MAG: DUF2256 domain-containing protein, partial [Giesbergeria sp.]